jgi:hypothetical protein
MARTAVTHPTGPLPQWTQVGGTGRDVFEAVDPSGGVWRLWAVAVPSGDDPFPPGYRLARRDDPRNINFITARGGLYFALDDAGLRIAGEAVRADPDGARREPGLE